MLYPVLHCVEEPSGGHQNGIYQSVSKPIIQNLGLSDNEFRGSSPVSQATIKKLIFETKPGPDRNAEMTCRLSAGHIEPKVTLSLILQIMLRASYLYFRMPLRIRCFPLYTQFQETVGYMMQYFDMVGVQLECHDQLRTISEGFIGSKKFFNPLM